MTCVNQMKMYCEFVRNHKRSLLVSVCECECVWEGVCVCVHVWVSVGVGRCG